MQHEKERSKARIIIFYYYLLSVLGKVILKVMHNNIVLFPKEVTNYV